MWRVAGKALPGEVEGFVDATSEEVGVSIQPSGVCLEPLDVSPVIGGQAEIAEHVVERTVLHDEDHDGVDQVERGHASLSSLGRLEAWSSDLPRWGVGDRRCTATAR